MKRVLFAAAAATLIVGVARAEGTFGFSESYERNRIAAIRSIRVTVCPTRCFFDTRDQRPDMPSH
jgi:hypothetical protein